MRTSIFYVAKNVNCSLKNLKDFQLSRCFQTIPAFNANLVICIFSIKSLVAFDCQMTIISQNSCFHRLCHVHCCVTVLCHVLPPLSQLCSDVLDFLNLKTIATRRILRKDLFIVFEFEIKKNELEIFRIKYPAIACQLFIKLSTLLFISLTSFNVQGMMPIHMIH